MNKGDITIIIPTIGSVSEKVFKEAFSSAIETSAEVVKNIIIVNNSQDSKFSSSLKGLTTFDSRINLLNIDKRVSMSNSWNYALKEVNTTWILYLHDDDVLISEKLNEVKPYLNDNLGFISFPFYFLFDGNYSKTKLVNHPFGFSKGKTTPKFVSTLINTNKILELNGFDDGCGYFLDTLMFMKLHYKYGSNHLNIPMGYYRITSAQSSNISNRYKMYGDYLPVFLKEAFELEGDYRERARIILFLLTFVYFSDILIWKVFVRLFRV